MTFSPDNINLFDILIGYWGTYILLGLGSALVFFKLKFSSVSILTITGLTFFFPVYSILMFVVPLMNMSA